MQVYLEHERQKRLVRLPKHKGRTETTARSCRCFRRTCCRKPRSCVPPSSRRTAKTHERTEATEKKEWNTVESWLFASRCTFSRRTNSPCVERISRGTSPRMLSRRSSRPRFRTHVNESRIDERADGQQDAQANEGFPEREVENTLPQAMQRSKVVVPQSVPPSKEHNSTGTPGRRREAKSRKSPVR